MSGRLDGRIALVTGAGSGIGRATAIRLATDGATVACCDVKGSDETASVITDGGGTATAHHLDVTDFAAVTSIVDEVTGQWGGIDIACNIAGIGHFAWSHEETAEGFDAVVRVNLHGTFHVCRAVLPSLIERTGVIINTASNAGIVGSAWSAAYCASKGGVVMLTKALAREYEAKGVRINAVAPGGTNTNIIDQFATLPDGGDPAALNRMISPFGYAEPEDIAAAFAFIASDEARFMTGAIVPVDGGLTA